MKLNPIHALTFIKKTSNITREKMRDKYNWRRLNKLQLGQYAEYFVKMEFTVLVFDVYSAEVDDRGIDFEFAGACGRKWWVY